MKTNAIVTSFILATSLLGSTVPTFAITQDHTGQHGNASHFNRQPDGPSFQKNVPHHANNLMHRQYIKKPSKYRNPQHPSSARTHIYQTKIQTKITLEKSVNALIDSHYDREKKTWTNSNTQPEFKFWINANLQETLINYLSVNAPLTTTNESNALENDIKNQIYSYAYSLDSITTTSSHAPWNDDQLWAALTFMRAYEAFPQSKNRAIYLSTAEKIVDAVHQSSSDPIRAHAEKHICGYGVVWMNRIGDDKTPYRNAITNELFMMASAKLAWLINDDKPMRKKYLGYAIDEWNWFFDKNTIQTFSPESPSGLLNKDLTINDGYNVSQPTRDKNQSTCIHDTDVTQIWSYNQGVILGGLLYLYHDLTLPQPAPVIHIKGIPSSQIVKKKLITLLTNDLKKSSIFINPDNILFEQACESSSNCNADQAAFKGIFMKYLNYTVNDIASKNPAGHSNVKPIQLPSALAIQSKTFLQDNAAAIINNAQSTQGEYDLQWTKRNTDNKINATTDMIAVDALQADYDTPLHLHHAPRSMTRLSKAKALQEK